jgi:hypothetical protein
MFTTNLRRIIGASAACLILAAAMPAAASHGSDDRAGDDRGGARDDRRSGGDDNRSGSSSSSASASSKASVRLIARMSGGGASAKAKYEAGPRRGVLVPKFSVEVEHARPGDKFEVSIAGRSFGIITANSLGVAKLELRRSPSGPNEKPIPADFPALKAGAVIKIGDMSGALR